MFSRLFKRRAPETSVLPADVAETIENAHLLTRSSEDDEGLPRVLVCFPGRRFYAESAAQAIADRWPDLNAAQRQRACNWIQSKVAAHLRAEFPASGPNGQPRWKDWSPHRDEFGELQA